MSFILVWENRISWSGQLMEVISYEMVFLKIKLLIQMKCTMLEDNCQANTDSRWFYSQVKSVLSWSISAYELLPFPCSLQTAAEILWCATNVSYFIIILRFILVMCFFDCHLLCPNNLVFPPLPPPPMPFPLDFYVYRQWEAKMTGQRKPKL